MAQNDVGAGVPYGASSLNGLLRAQLAFVGEQVEAYLTCGNEFALDALRTGEGDPKFTLGLMPHEWGSVDSWAYMRDALQIATEMMDRISNDADLNDDGVKRFIRDLVRDKWMRLEGFAEDVAQFAELATYDPETDGLRE